MKITYIDNPGGPRLGLTSAKTIEKDGLFFRDLEGTGVPSCPCWLQRKLLRRGHPPERLPSGEEDSPLRLLTSLFAVNRPGSSLLAQGHGLNMPERHVSRKSRSASQQAPRSPSKYQIK